MEKACCFSLSLPHGIVGCKKKYLVLQVVVIGYSYRQEARWFPPNAMGWVTDHRARDPRCSLSLVAVAPVELHADAVERQGARRLDARRRAFRE